MDYILAFSVVSVILGVLISMLSKTSEKNVGSEIPAPHSLILTRIQCKKSEIKNEEMNDLEAIASERILYDESILHMDLECFPFTVGKKERKANPKKGIVVLPEEGIETGVAKRHILVNQEQDAKTGEIYYTIENIAKTGTILYYCNDDQIPQEKKYGRLFHNIANRQKKQNGKCIVFYDSITLKVGEVILRFYDSQYYREKQFQSFVEEQEGELEQSGAEEATATHIVEKKLETDGENRLIEKACTTRKTYTAIVAEGDSDVGKRRQRNEDALLLLPEHQFYCVCDGMGGMERGQESSKLSVDMIEKLFTTKTIQNVRNKMETMSSPLEAYKNALYYVIQYVSNYLFHLGEEQKTNSYLYGTTFSGVWIQGNQAIIGNLGDSRTYICRQGNPNMQQVTKDHSYVQMMVDCGRMTPEDAKRSTRKNEIMQFMGMDPDEIMPDIFVEEIQAGDQLLLCTDGLTNMVSEEEIQKIICNTKADVKKKCKELIKKANQNGGKDNITIVLIEIV